ncbi:MAG: TIGR04282 family arsenosugar biosynthesis glycosyltransferase, partial [Planctomycetes bacterium]|nr:TIGR04282 family arsenosugar biosynthesis glycosyltransferase [Planctomycetota bacterium]
PPAGGRASRPAVQWTPDRALGLFLKAPRPGHVKTRLGAALGMGRAAAFYRAMVGDVVSAAARVPRTALFVFFSPARERRICEELVRAALPGGRALHFLPQRGKTLGQRMERAFKEMLGWLAVRPASTPARARKRRQFKALLAGTDMPRLESRHFQEAFRRLDSRAVVFGPARDGGYYLVGLKRPIDFLFRHMPWSTGKVLRLSLKRLRQARLSYALLPWHGDVDTGEDLDKLWAELRHRVRNGQAVPPRSLRWCRRFFQKSPKLSDK